MTNPSQPPEPRPSWLGLVDEARRRADADEEATVTHDLREARTRLSSGSEQAPAALPPVPMAEPLFTPSTFVRVVEPPSAAAPDDRPAAVPSTPADTTPLPNMLRASASGRTDRIAAKALATSLLHLAASPLAQIVAAALVLVAAYLGFSGEPTTTSAGRSQSTASILRQVGQPLDAVFEAGHRQISLEPSRALLTGDGAAALTAVAAQDPTRRAADPGPQAASPAPLPGDSDSDGQDRQTVHNPDRAAVTPGALLPLSDIIDDRAPDLAVVIVRGLPAGFALTGAMRGADGGWVVGLDMLERAALAIPTDAAGEVGLQIELIDLAARSLGERSLLLAIEVPRTLPAPEPQRIAGWLFRGRALVAAGDIPAARLLLLRAAEAGDGQAAHALAATYDAEVLRQRGAAYVSADPIRARYWYAQAASAGVAEAREALSRLGAVATAGDARAQQ